MATLRQQQDGGYVLPWQHYDNNKMVAMRYHGNDDVILHLQQYSHGLNLFFCMVKLYDVNSQVTVILTLSAVRA